MIATTVGRPKTAVLSATTGCLSGVTPRERHADRNTTRDRYCASDAALIAPDETGWDAPPLFLHASPRFGRPEPRRCLAQWCLVGRVHGATRLGGVGRKAAVVSCDSSQGHC